MKRSGIRDVHGSEKTALRQSLMWTTFRSVTRQMLGFTLFYPAYSPCRCGTLRHAQQKDGASKRGAPVIAVFRFPKILLDFFFQNVFRDRNGNAVMHGL